MKSYFLNIIKRSLKIFGAFLILTFIFSCKKEEVKKESINPSAINENLNPKLAKYLSITTNTNINQISYDSKTKEYVIKDIYKVLKKDLEERYAVANEYKLQFENKND